MNAKTKRHPIFWRFSAILIVLIASAAIWWHFHTKTNNNNLTPNSPAPAKVAANNSAKRPRNLAPVQVATIIKQNMPRYLTGLGTITATNTVTITSRIDGELITLHFTEGQQVKAGDLLAEIDPRPFQAELTQAQGQLAKDQATLANAKRDLARYQQLIKTNLISHQELDTQLSLVQQSEGAIKMDQGIVDNAKLQLSYTNITAPISGRVGLKLIDVGNFITSANTPIVVITQTQPIDMIFTLPENNIQDVLKAQKNGAVSVEAWDRSGNTLLAKGQLLSLDNQIDTTTGTIKLKAQFPNKDNALFPNQFVNARIKIATLQNAIIAPAAAVQMGNKGHFVWVIDDNNHVSKQFVTLGIENNQSIVIENGLEAGQKVVTDGIDQLTEGTKVEVVPALESNSNENANNKKLSNKPAAKKQGNQH